jgi:hypothetical protein
MHDVPHPLSTLLCEEATVAIAPSVRAIADAARACHGDEIAAVLVYGSCLREGDDLGKVVDLYLLSDSYGSVYKNPLMRVANALLPPNVFYLETPFEERTVRCKYAIVSLSHFERLVTPSTFHPYFWARFAQPTAVAWLRNRKTKRRVVGAMAQAVMTLIAEAGPLVPANAGSRNFWIRAFSETYQTELRAERPDRAIHLYETHAARYDRIADLMAEMIVESSAPAGSESIDRTVSRWKRRRLLGKVLSVLRLMKSAFTFHDGPIYLMWKIEQHSGVKVKLTPWQRRHPILASPTMFWRLYRKGAFH